MALDLLHVEVIGYWDSPYHEVSAGYLLARMCEEAGVCLHDTDGPGNSVRMEAATFEKEQGIVVTDSRGKRFRLRVTAEEVSDGS